MPESENETENARCKRPFLLLYGSQLGQAKSIAEDICKEAASKYNMQPNLHDMADYGKGFNLLEEPCIVIITSTTGDGDPPDNAAKMWRALSKKTLPSDHLKHVRFTILGLGDTNYNNFCNCGRSFNRRLLELGAKHFYPPGWADDGTGLEVVIEPWLDGLWPALKQELLGDAGLYDRPLNIVSEPMEPNVPSEVSEDVLQAQPLEPSLHHSTAALSEAALNIPIMPECSMQVSYHPEEDLSSLEVQNSCPFPSCVSEVMTATIDSASILSQGEGVKFTLELVLNLQSDGYDFLPGDSIGIVPENDDAEVKRLLTCLDVEDKANHVCKISFQDKTKEGIAAHVLRKAPLKYLLKTCCDIRAVPKKSLIRLLAEFTTNSQEKRRLQELCSRQGAKDYSDFVRSPALSVLDLLLAFPSCKPPVSCLLEHLPRLQPRPYSIASSPLASPNKIHILFNVVEIPAGDGRQFSRRGVCTGWLTQLVQSKLDAPVEDQMRQLSISGNETQIKVFFRRSSTFKIPTDPAVPCIMIGAGTGLAPFIGFLQHKALLQQQNTTDDFGEYCLFHGCRYKDKDSLFRARLAEYLSAGVLNCLHVAHSREPNSTAKYVQDAITAHMTDFVDQLLGKHSKLFVCGDAKNMAVDVFQAIVLAISKVKGISETEARRIVAQLQVDRYYLQDVWT